MKILLYTDLAIRPDQLFWHRDLGLLTKAFRDLGHNALLVVHNSDNSQSKIKNARASASRNCGEKSNIQDDSVLWVSQQDVRNPLWWKDHHPDLVILGLWTRPKYDPIRRAALSATPRVIERADSDGMRTASCGLLNYAKRRFDYFRDRTFRWPSLLSIPASVFDSFSSILATPWIEYRLRKTLQLLPSILVETPPATLLWKSLATRLRVDPSKIHCVPHPIQTDIFKFDPATPKKNQIISVGRWESYQKNFPLLLKTLCTFLHENPPWSSLVIGSGLPTKSPHPRVTLLPSLTPEHLARLMRESRVFLFSSRYESFLLAGAEALTAGCSVVGPEALPSTSYFSEFTRKNQPLKLGKSRLSVNNNKRSPPKKEIRLSSLQSCRAALCFSPISVAKNILKIMIRQESGL